ncbi:tRNA dimethylallyltransferase 9 [Aristolochia californica]|uniref:tRNA dimethylallyltransferase 9 n=1 Tax=Aristolochia californica TaxID=171875 RepID=UPI0035DC9998
MGSSGVGVRMWSLRLIRTPLHLPRNIAAHFSPSRRSLRTSCSTTTLGNDKKKKKVIVISGPTGAGKSKLALELAKRLNGEIISADSVQVYRGLDVGSAKPLPSDRKEVPHHLIDILHPSEEYSAGQFFEDARHATKDIFDHGCVPIVTGGTGLYLRWYIYGKPEVPKVSLEIGSEVCSELNLLQQNGDWDVAVELLEKAGDPRAKSLARNDWYRLQRSLEIIKATGSPPSAFHIPYDSFMRHLYSSASLSCPGDYTPPNHSEENLAKDRHGDYMPLNHSDENLAKDRHGDYMPPNHSEENLAKDLDYDFLCFFLSSQRVELYRRIDLRCEEMLTETQGLLSEATWLLESGLLPNMNSATRAIGYRQAMEYLSFCRKNGGQSSPRDFFRFLSDFQKASRNFAKRQMTWFRSELIYQWLDASQPLETVLNYILDAYHDQTRGLVVPSVIKMDRGVSSRKEIFDLKTYRTSNRVFVQPEDCSHILDWVRRTQR